MQPPGLALRTWSNNPPSCPPPPAPTPPAPQSASDYLFRTCSMRAGARLALLQAEPHAAEALLFETPCGSRAAAAQSAGAHAAYARSFTGPLTTSEGVDEDVVASFMGLQNTLLASAVAQGAARFVSDCRQYMQVGHGGSTCRQYML